MNVLFIYAHPNSKSFNHAILEELVSASKKNGHNVEVSDLYNKKFDPVLTTTNNNSFIASNLSNDIKLEQEALNKADLLVFIYPVWWYGMPAILKGWVDRIFTNGFAYRYDSSTEELQGLLDKKKAVVINTVDADEEYYYKHTSLGKAMSDIVNQGILDLVGIKNIMYKMLYSVSIVSDLDRKNMLKQLSFEFSDLLKNN